MKQTRQLGVVNNSEEAKVHAVQTSYADSGLRTRCSFQRIYCLVNLDTSDVDQLCKRCFAKLPLPWGTS